MAGSEVYRVEIPIIIDDQSEAPLSKARERVNKFEQSARKTNERIRRDFEGIAKLQIEPVMRVKDQLTDSVMRADKLIRKLDVAQASPLIAAQDRVSVVVTRVNAMLDALDKGRVDVFAEMKGPLMDEIIKARASLSALDGATAGPVAELRGELFGQLSKAMSQVKGLDISRAQPEATLRDRVSATVGKVAGTLRGLTTRAWTVTVSVKDRVTGFLGRIGRTLMSPLGLLGMGGLAMGPMALIGGAIKTAGEFEQSLANVQSVAGASAEELQRLRDTALEAGRTTVFKASEAADALYYLASAGFNVNQQIGALEGTLALAAATQADLAFTSELVAGTIAAFSLEAEEADRIANVFAATIAGSPATINKIADSMKYAGPAAAGFGRSIEETMAVMALFYKQNLTGEMAGTRFRSALASLAHPAGETKNALAALGISAKQVDPSLNNLADIIDLLKSKGVDTTMAIRLFGQETGPAMASLIAQGGRALRDMERQLTGTNKAFEMQETQLDTLTGAQKEFQSVWESVSITLGTQSIPGLRRLVEWLKETIGNSEELAKKIGERVNRALEWLADILESPEFKEATFIEKVQMLFEAGLDGVNTWLEGPGGEMISDTIERMGTLLATGIEELTSVIVPVAVNLGLEIGKGILSGVWDAITSDPIVGAILGALAGAKAGAMAGTIFGLPGVAVGAVGGAVVGGGAAILKGGITEKSKYKGIPNPMMVHASGGILTRPHLGLVAESGPEAIIPLSERTRTRALGLWEETGKRLGVKPYAEGGFTRTVPVAVPTGTGTAANVNINFDLAGLVGQVVINKESDIDKAVDKIADNLRSVFQNMVKK